MLNNNITIIKYTNIKNIITIILFISFYNFLIMRLVFSELSSSFCNLFFGLLCCSFGSAVFTCRGSGVWRDGRQCKETAVYPRTSRSPLWSHWSVPSSDETEPDLPSSAGPDYPAWRPRRPLDSTDPQDSAPTAAPPPRTTPRHLTQEVTSSQHYIYYFTF